MSKEMKLRELPIDFITETSDYVSLWNKHSPNLASLHTRRHLLKQQKDDAILDASIFLDPPKRGSAVMEGDIDAMVSSVSKDAGTAFIEEEVLSLVINNIRGIKMGMSYGHRKTARVKVTVEKMGVTAGHSIGMIATSSDRADSYHPKQHLVEPGEVLYGRPLYMSTLPEFGGRIIVAGMLRNTHIQGLVNPETAEPRASVEVYIPA